MSRICPNVPGFLGECPERLEIDMVTLDMLYDFRFLWTKLFTTFVSRICIVYTIYNTAELEISVNKVRLFTCTRTFPNCVRFWFVFIKQVFTRVGTENRRTRKCTI